MYDLYSGVQSSTSKRWRHFVLASVSHIYRTVLVRCLVNCSIYQGFIGQYFVQGGTRDVLFPRRSIFPTHLY